MLPSLALSSSSLDQFRKNVYRPRLCLLLLLVLLSPYNTTQLTAPSDASAVSISQPAQQGWSISIIDGLVVAAAPSASEVLSPAASTPAPSVNPKHGTKAASKSSAAIPSLAPSNPETDSAAHSTAHSTAQQGQPPPGSLFRFPKLSWGLIIDEHVLPAVLPLHLLWTIRLAAMAVEDGLLKTSLLGAKSPFYSVTLPLIYLAVLCTLAILTGHPATVAEISTHCHVWRQQLGFELSDLPSSETKAKSIFQADGLLPSSLFVMLETASTIVHLISILPKVDASLISSILPMQLKLPSPSHLPPLVELLPLPSAVKAALTETAATRPTTRYENRRRPMMPSTNTTESAGLESENRSDPSQQQQRGNHDTASATSLAVDSTHVGGADGSGDGFPQQTYRRVGAPENDVLRSTSVAQPIAPLQLSENTEPSSTSNEFPSASRRRRAPRLRGQSVLVSTKWLSETATALFDKVIGSFVYAIITLRLPTLSPTSLLPVLSLLSLRSELASLTQIWSRARNSVECLEFVRRRWGVQLEQGQDPYASVSRPRAAAAAGDYHWKSYDDVYCAICFEQTRSAADPGQKSTDDAEKDHEPRRFEFCRLDCGHELHDVCLVSWLTAQAFCPTCHVVLSFSPRTTAATRRSAGQA